MIKLIRTARWNDPSSADDGYRLLITRYRPRGVAKADETWDAWQPALGPSRELHAAYWGKGQLKIDWKTYLSRYRVEMREHKPLIDELAQCLARGEQITLLCSTACVRESRCHRSILKQLIEKRAQQIAGGAK